MTTILAVDDEAAILDITRWTLRRRFEVLTATGGEAGLALLAGQSVDLVISDMRMPGMSGLEFLTEVRRLYPGIPLLLATAYTNDADIRRAVEEVGIFRLVAKPWLPEELLEAVEDALAPVR